MKYSYIGYLKSLVLSVAHAGKHPQHELDVSVVLLVNLLQVIILHHGNHRLRVLVLVAPALPLLFVSTLLHRYNTQRARATVKQESDDR